MMNEEKSAKVLWSDDSEVNNRAGSKDLLFQVSGFAPFHTHKGSIVLNDEFVVLNDYNNEFSETIPLQSVREIFLGFDEIYTNLLSKNIGLFWSPLRLTLQNFRKLYLIIRYNGLYTENNSWFSEIKEKLENI